MYKSPVEIVMGQLKTEQENHIVSVIQEMGVNVDKDELVKALEYDRNQYTKGFNDGVKEFAERLENEIISDSAYGCDCKQFSGYYDYTIKIGDIPEYIDKLKKEMVGAN